MKDLDSKKIFEAYNKKRKETLIKESDKPILIPPRKGFDPSGPKRTLVGKNPRIYNNIPDKPIAIPPRKGSKPSAPAMITTPAGKFPAPDLSGGKEIVTGKDGNKYIYDPVKKRMDLFGRPDLDKPYHFSKTKKLSDVVADRDKPYHFSPTKKLSDVVTARKAQQAPK
mgnify:CR=1 FL=1